MADLQRGSNWLVSPNIEVELKWAEVAIQEKKSRIIRHRQDIEDLKKGAIVDLEAKIMMLEKEVIKLEEQKAALTPINVGG